jgi:hypothetical protein
MTHNSQKHCQNGNPSNSISARQTSADLQPVIGQAILGQPQSYYRTDTPKFMIRVKDYKIRQTLSFFRSSCQNQKLLSCRTFSITYHNNEPSLRSVSTDKTALGLIVDLSHRFNYQRGSTLTGSNRFQDSETLVSLVTTAIISSPSLDSQQPTSILLHSFEAPQLTCNTHSDHLSPLTRTSPSPCPRPIPTSPRAPLRNSISPRILPPKPLTTSRRPQKT